MPNLSFPLFWIALVSVLSLGPAQAASRSCRQPEASLAGGGEGRTARAYDRAIAAQQAAIDEAKRRMGAPGCNGWGRASSACAGLAAAMPKKKANLRELRAGRSGMGSSRALLARAEATLRANGCRSDPAKPVTVKAVIDVAATEVAVHPSIRFPRLGGAGSVCVRLCDGYFFPMTRTRAPVDDQTNCEASCPGTPMEVFYGRDGADEAAMSSAATGRRYGEVGTAFQFRDGKVKTPPGCGCKRTTASLEAPVVGDIRKTLAVSVPAAAAGPSVGRRIRVVGPTFLPDPAEAIDLRAPAPIEGR